MREVFFGIYSFKKATQLILFSTTSPRLDLIFTFSAFDQFSTVSSVLKSISIFRNTYKFNAAFYSILKPQSGFLTSNKRFVAPEFITGGLPEDVYYTKTVFLSFGQDALGLLLKELAGRVGSLVCGVVDSNQKKV